MYSGSAIPNWGGVGANTVPVTVVSCPGGHITCCLHRLSQPAVGPLPLPQTLGSPAPPQVAPPGHSPHSSEPPQPSPTRPHRRPPICSQAIGLQFGSRGAPHRFFTPPPPQVRPIGQSAPHSIVPRQPSPILPQYLPPGGVQLSFWQVPLSGWIATGASVVVGGAASGRTKPPLPPAPLPLLPARPGLVEPPAPPAPVPLMDGDPQPRASSARVTTEGKT